MNYSLWGKNAAITAVCHESHSRANSALDHKTIERSLQLLRCHRTQARGDLLVTSLGLMDSGAAQAAYLLPTYPFTLSVRGKCLWLSAPSSLLGRRRNFHQCACYQPHSRRHCPVCHGYLEAGRRYVSSARPLATGESGAQFKHRQSKHGPQDVQLALPRLHGQVRTHLAVNLLHGQQGLFECWLFKQTARSVWSAITLNYLKCTLG